jgi:hypothetical protein
VKTNLQRAIIIIIIIVAKQAYYNHSSIMLGWLLRDQMMSEACFGLLVQWYPTADVAPH